MRILLMFFLILSGFEAKADAVTVDGLNETAVNNIAGSWLTYEDGKPESRVEIVLQGDEVTASIVEIFNSKDAEALCDKCSGALHNKPVVGLQIVSALQLDDGVWKGGEVLDPKTGKLYKCQITVDEDVLMLKAWWGFISQTREWRRAPPQT